MPRLTRKNIKVFAGNATNNGVFGSLQANNPTTTADIEQIQSLNAWGEGWNAATETSEELPPLEEIQSVSYVTTYQQAYIMQEGIPEWAATVTYYKGCLTKEVTSTGFKIYNSLTDNNTGNLLSDTSNWKKVMDSDDLYAFDNTVVHLTGNETITGVKKFIGDNPIIILQNSTVTYNTAPSSNTYTYISFRDKNGYEMGALEHVRMPDNNTEVRIVAKGVDGNWSSALAVGKKADGTTYTIAPTPTAGDNSTKIATTAFVTTADSNLQTQINTKANTADVVNLTGTQTISGTKTFSGWGGYTTYIKHNDVTYNTAPSSDKSVAIAYTDKNGVAIGVVESWRYPSNGTCTQLNVYGANGAWASKSLGLIVEADGYTWAYAPHSDYYDSIVTTRGIGKWDNGYVRLGNGIIIQWGWHSGSGSTLTFPTPFTSTNYSVTANYRKQSSSGSGIGHVNFYPTSTTSCYFNSQGGDFQWIAIGY